MKTKDKYDRQLVVSFYTGAGDDIIRDSSVELAKAFAKLKGVSGLSGVVSIDSDNFSTENRQDLTNLAEQMRDLTTESRLYLNGHGDWEAQKLGALGPKEVAKILVSAGMPAVKTICITACGLGRKRTTGLIFKSTSSFASKFHSYLKEKYSIKCEVHAYVLSMAVYGPTTEMIRDEKDPVKIEAHKLLYGRKFTFGDGHNNIAWKRPMSKRILTWEGEKQRINWALGNDDSAPVFVD